MKLMKIEATLQDVRLVLARRRDVPSLSYGLMRAAGWPQCGLSWPWLRPERFWGGRMCVLICWRSRPSPSAGRLPWKSRKPTWRLWVGRSLNACEPRGSTWPEWLGADEGGSGKEEGLPGVGVPGLYEPGLDPGCCSAARADTSRDESSRATRLTNSGRPGGTPDGNGASQTMHCSTMENRPERTRDTPRFESGSVQLIRRPEGVGRVRTVHVPK